MTVAHPDAMAAAIRPYKVLFLCTGNSARSIMAEALLNQTGQGCFMAFSAGSHPAKKVHRHTRELLEQRCISTEPLYCKSWREFAAPGAPAMHCIILLSADLMGRPHPAWHGRPLIAYWCLRDPVAVVGSADRKRQAFLQVFETLEMRIKRLVTLPAAGRGTQRLCQELDLVAAPGCYT
jgi:arsenate reductase (thioredoxin)